MFSWLRQLKRQVEPPIFLGCLIFAGTGALMLLGSFYWMAEPLRLSVSGRAAKGWVQEIKEEQNWEAKKGLVISYYPVIQFRDRSGATRTFQTRAGSSRLPDEVKGDRVEVVYLPDEPKVARLNVFREMWAGPLLVGIMGMMSVAAAGLMFKGFRKN